MENLQFTAGVYAKVIVDDNGRVIGSEELEPCDLPKHTHVSEEITDLEREISRILSHFFANNGNSAVIFDYDERTRTITADVNIDGDSIKKNQYGQLTSLSSGCIVRPSNDSNSNDSSSSDSSSNDSDDKEEENCVCKAPIVGSAEIEESLRRLTKKIDSLEDSIPNLLFEILPQVFANSAGTAVDFEWDSNTHTFQAEVNIDGISISKDENGDLIATGATAGSGENGNCASHTHLSGQIEDFEEAVKNLFDDYSKNISIDLSTLVDGVTIKVNQFGQLTAVSSALAEHTHTLSEITDYKEPEPAAKQYLNVLEGIDPDEFKSGGLFDLSKLNIGYAILAINRYLLEVDKRFDNLQKKIEGLQFEKDNNGQCILSVSENSMKNFLMDSLENNEIKEVFYGPDTYLELDYLPYQDGTLFLYQNGVEVAKASIKNLQAKDKREGIFSVIDAYRKGAFIAKVLKIDVTKLLPSEEKYTFQILFQTEDGKKDFTNKVAFFSTPYDKLTFQVEDITDNHTILGQTFYDYPLNLKLKVKIEDYKNYRFLPFNSDFNDEGIAFLKNIYDRRIKVPLQNLFSKDEIEFEFVHEVEHSELSDMLKVIKEGALINDCIYPESKMTEVPYTAIFKVPFSTDKNSLRLKCTDPAFQIEMCSLKKQQSTSKIFIAQGTQRLTDNKKGFLKLPDNTYILSFGNDYDTEAFPMELEVKSTSPLHLNTFEFSSENL